MVGKKSMTGVGDVHRLDFGRLIGDVQERTKKLRCDTIRVFFQAVCATHDFLFEKRTFTVYLVCG